MILIGVTWASGVQGRNLGAEAGWAGPMAGKPGDVITVSLELAVVPYPERSKYRNRNDASLGLKYINEPTLGCLVSWKFGRLG